MTVRETAKRLEVSQSTIYALVAAGRLRCVRHGLKRGVIRITEQQLADYMDGAQPKVEAPRATKWIR
jgi:excisionase family DNA binding protein